MAPAHMFFHRSALSYGPLDARERLDLALSAQHQEQFCSWRMTDNRALSMYNDCHGFNIGLHVSATVPKGARVLELGPGRGNAAAYLLNFRDVHVDCIDSKTLLDFADTENFLECDFATVMQRYRVLDRRREFDLLPGHPDYGRQQREDWLGPTFAQQRARLHWVLADTAEYLPLQWTDRFHFAMATWSLEYLRNPLRAIEEVYRVLAPGGTAALSLTLLSALEFRRYPQVCLEDRWLCLRGFDFISALRSMQDQGFDIELRHPANNAPVEADTWQDLAATGWGVTGVRGARFSLRLAKQKAFAEDKPLRFPYRLAGVPGAFTRVYRPI